MSSGLPPVHRNKMTSRSKTASFKRPASCVDSEVMKKEPNRLFNFFNKTPSNSKLNEDCHDDVSFSSLTHGSSKPKAAMFNNKFAGRDFGSDDDEFPEEMNETKVTKLEKYFIDPQKVVNDPVLTATLLKYLNTYNQDYKSLLFYLITQYYQFMAKSKDFLKEATKYANEIFTTFLADNSILLINHTFDRETILNDLRNNSNMTKIFDKISNEVFDHCILENLKSLRQSILHGLFDTNVSFSTPYDAKLSQLNEVVKEIITKFDEELTKINKKMDNPTSESIERHQIITDSLLAIKTSLATIYYYFMKREKDDISDNISVSSKGLKNNFIARSMENLQSSTSFVLDKQPIFCSKQHKRNLGHSILKRIKNYKGHSFQEKFFEFPCNCMHCAKLLWGVGPQGYVCTHCQEGVHKNCRENVTKTCSKQDGRKYQRNYSTSGIVVNSSPSSSIVQASNSTASTGDEDSKVNLTVQEENSNFNTTTHSDNKDPSDVENESCDKEDAKSLNSAPINDIHNNSLMTQSMTTSGTSSMYSSLPPTHSNHHSNYNNSSLSLGTKTNIIISNSEDDHLNQDSGSDLSQVNLENRSNDSSKKSNVQNLANKFNDISNKSISRSQSDENMDNRTMPRTSKRTSESVLVQDLVETSSWANDPDMHVGETFEADLELKAFPKHTTSDIEKSEYVRLLVMMEFNHKIKFIIMTLKRFDYLLIKQWPQQDSFLFNTLSLNCIEPLYKLIKTLAKVIESCKNEATFSKDTAFKVYNWLVENNEQNLNEWLRYSMDLCCTNSLQIVKNQWREMRKNDPSFKHVLYKRHNKMIVVEQLSNTKPLLFNLPLIINKVIRDLSKFSKFKEETKIWKNIHEKLKTLPAYIDEHCMPLIDQINHNKIINGHDRGTWQSRLNQNNEPFFDYIADFPKTAFHYKMFDFQEIKISNFRGTSKGKQSAVYVKEVSDAYAICYDEMLVLLTKENDKFVLKQFKAADTSKINPILALDSVHASKPPDKISDSKYELTLVFINDAVLTQIIFNKKTTMNDWYNFIYETKSKNKSNSAPRKIKEDKEKKIESDLIEITTNHKPIHNEFADKLKNVIDDPYYISPSNVSQCCLGTIMDSASLIHESYELMDKGSIDEESATHLVKTIDNLKLRINNYIETQKIESGSVADVPLPFISSPHDEVVCTTDDIANENNNNSLTDANKLQVIKDTEENGDVSSIEHSYENESIDNDSPKPHNDQEELETPTIYLEDIDPTKKSHDYDDDYNNYLLNYSEKFVDSVLTDAQKEMNFHYSMNSANDDGDDNESPTIETSDVDDNDEDVTNTMIDTLSPLPNDSEEVFYHKSTPLSSISEDSKP